MDPRSGGVGSKQDWVESHLQHVAEAWPDLNMTVEGLVTRLSKFGRYIDLVLADTLKEFDLNQSEYKVLVNLKGSGSDTCSPGDLCGRMLVSSGSMTNRLDRLEKAGLIRRMPDPDDRRGVLVELTDEGDKLIEAAVYVQGRREERLFDDLSDDERQTLDDLLRKLSSTLESRYGPPPKKRTEGEA
jgi:DNA-binding MarR family transcriptional regulator